MSLATIIICDWTILTFVWCLLLLVGGGVVEPEPASVWLGANCVYESTKLRLGYASLVTPKQVINEVTLHSLP